MNKCKKIITIIMIIIAVLVFSSNITFVYGEEEDPINNPSFYEPIDTTGNNTQFINIGNIIIGTMRALGTVIAVVALMVIGLKYMYGTLEERAAYKETMVPYLIGAVMLFTIPNILGIIYDLVKGIQF